MNQKLKDMDTAAARPKTTVSGAAAPQGLLGSLEPTSVVQVDALSCCGDGVGYHFSHDCPIELTTMPTGAPVADNAQAMIEAVVEDLKGAFQFYADSHAKIGAPTPQPVEASA